MKVNMINQFGIINSVFKDEALRQIAMAAFPYYSCNAAYRGYHNWNHAMSVLQALPENPSDELALAAVWHDAVYIAGATNNVNEKASAAALLLAYKIHGEKNDGLASVVISASALIEQTTIECHMSPAPLAGDLAALLDADLASLAYPWESFIDTQRNILAENFLWPDAKNLRLSAIFLEKLANSRDSIYHTELARSKWEAPARHNIDTLMQHYGFNN